MTTRELVEAAASAFRPATVDGGVGAHPAWHDLDDEGRGAAFELATALRKMEAALDPDGLSTTCRAVVARIARAR